MLAAELACRADDATLAQEAALRFANCVAPVLASATRPRAMVAAIAQCLETLAESGKARTTTIARCAASLAFELASRAASTGEWKTLADVAALRVDALDPPLGAPNPTRADLEQYLLSIPGWRGFESEALASRADAAGATEAEDPLALVASKIAEDGVDAGFEALTALGEEAHAWNDHLRAFFIAVDAALAAGHTETLAERAETTVRAHVDATRVPPPAFPDPPASEAPAELEPEEETRVAELENAAAEVASVVEPEPLAETHTEEERAAWEEAREAWERARPIKEAAEGAREDATARAEIREKAARALTRKLPPLFARRNAALAARPIVAANAPWHAAVRTALGRAAHEAVVAKWTPPENFDAEKETDASNANRDDPDANASPPPPPPPPPALDAVVELTRGVEIAARCGDVGRLTDAVRALYDAIAGSSRRRGRRERSVGETRRREVSARRRRARRRTPPTSSRRRGGRGRVGGRRGGRIALARRRRRRRRRRRGDGTTRVHARSGRGRETNARAVARRARGRRRGVFDAVRGHGGGRVRGGGIPPPRVVFIPRRGGRGGDGRVRD